MPALGLRIFSDPDEYASNTAKPLHAKAQRRRSGTAAKRHAGSLAEGQSPYAEGITQKRMPCAPPSGYADVSPQAPGLRKFNTFGVGPATDAGVDIPSITRYIT